MACQAKRLCMLVSGFNSQQGLPLSLYLSAPVLLLKALYHLITVYVDIDEL